MIMIQNMLLILSGDHIYKMDYSKMLEFPQRKRMLKQQLQ